MAEHLTAKAKEPKIRTEFCEFPECDRPNALPKTAKSRLCGIHIDLVKNALAESKRMPQKPFKGRGVNALIRTLDIEEIVQVVDWYEDRLRPPFSYQSQKP